MIKKTILLVEDNFLNRRLSKKILSEYGYLVLEAKNAKETKELLANNVVDLVILDINLGENEQDGISLGQYIKDHYELPYIYLTAYENPEIISKAVATSPYSYLTKPFKKVDLITSVEIAIRQSIQLKKEATTIQIKDRGYNINIAVDAIQYIVSDGNYLNFHTDDKVYKCRGTIKQILEKLPTSGFVQTHRAYVVNKDKIEKYSYNSLFINGTEIPISKNYIEDLDVLGKK